MDKDSGVEQCQGRGREKGMGGGYDDCIYICIFPVGRGEWRVWFVGRWVVGISERLLWIGGARVVSWVDDVDIDEELG